MQAPRCTVVYLYGPVLTMALMASVQMRGPCSATCACVPLPADGVRRDWVRASVNASWSCARARSCWRRRRGGRRVTRCKAKAGMRKGKGRRSLRRSV